MLGLFKYYELDNRASLQNVEIRIGNELTTITEISQQFFQDYIYFSIKIYIYVRYALTKAKVWRLFMLYTNKT